MLRYMEAGGGLSLSNQVGATPCRIYLSGNIDILCAPAGAEILGKAPSSGMEVAVNVPD